MALNRLTQEAPELTQFVQGEGDILVDGYYMFISGNGQISWAAENDAYLYEDAEFVRPNSSEETLQMRKVRKMVEKTSILEEVRERAVSI